MVSTTWQKVLFSIVLGVAIAPPALADIAPVSPTFQLARQLRIRLGNIEASEGRFGALARRECSLDPSVRPLVDMADSVVAMGPILSPAVQNSDGILLEQATLGIPQTLSSQPIFYAYIPPMGIEQGEFAIVKLIDEHHEELIHFETIDLPPDGGIIRIDSLVANDIYLEPNQRYLWTVQLYCDQMNPRQAGQNPISGALLHTVAPETALDEQLRQVDARDRLVIYAEAGLWYEAIDLVAQLLQARPDDPALLADWHSLLEAGNLDAIADARLVMPDRQSVTEAPKTP